MTQNQTLTHLDANGDIAMVDVSTKTATTRTATATGQVIFPADIYTAIKNADGMTKKGSITQTAYIAGVMGAKSTSDLIPLCHPLPLDSVKMSFDYADSHHAITVTATAKVTHKTGVEMEALTAVSVACLTIYDMTKAISHDIIISDIKLLTKTGGSQTMPTNKQIDVLYFASLAEQAGKYEERLSFDGDSLVALYQQLTERYNFRLAQHKIAVAINHEITDWDTPIQQGDIVAFIPPVAGG